MVLPGYISGIDGVARTRKQEKKCRTEENDRVLEGE